MIITKSTGLQEPFNKGKLKQSLLRSGANAEQADEIDAEYNCSVCFFGPTQNRDIAKVVGAQALL